MGLKKVIKDALHHQFFLGQQAHLVARGLAIPLDPFTLGQVRFGRKLEFVMPILAPENQYQLEDDAIYQMDRIILDRDVKWMEPGGFISIGERELHSIADITDDTIILETRLLADHPAGQPVYHYSNPIVVEGAYSQGEFIINVDSPHFIVRGDKLAISILPGISVSIAFREYVVEDYHLVSVINSIQQYQVTLDKPIHRSLVDDEEIQLRAFLAYKSKIINIPTTPGTIRKVVGPFLLDWVSAPFVEDKSVSEVQTIQKYDAARVPIGPPLTVEKNTLMLDLSIRADQFLFWDKVRGEMNYDDGIGKFLMLLDDSGKWRTKHTCVPPVKVPFTYASGSIVTTDPTGLTNNEWFRIDDSTNAMVFEYHVTDPFVPTSTAKATGQIGITSIPLNNSWFSLNDGFGNEFFFEFMQDAPSFTPTPNYYTIDVTAAVFPVDVAVKVVEMVNSLPLKIVASRVVAAVNLTHEEISIRGNEPIQLDPVLVWGLVGMSGGTDDVEIIDITSVTTDVEVAQLTAAAINRTGIQVRAEFPGVFNSFRLFSSVPGTTGNIPITYLIVNPAFIILGMTGGSGGVKWHFDVTPDQDILLRLRLYPNDWLPDQTLPAGVASTVAVELLSTDLDVERIDLLVRGLSGGNASGQIDVASVPVNNNWFYLDDGFGNAYYFEFMQDAATFTPTPNYTTVDVTGALFPIDVALKVVAAINALPLKMAAVNTSTTVELTHNYISTEGNQLIQIDPALVPPWAVTGMAGGLGNEVQMGDWVVTTRKIGAIAHEYVAQLSGDYTFASTGLYAKALFQSLDDVQMRYDFTGQYNAGFLKL